MLTEQHLLSQPFSDMHLAESDEVSLDTQRATLLTWGNGHSYPQLWFKAHLAIGEGLRCWRLVAEKASDEEIELALAATGCWPADLLGPLPA